MGRGYQSPNQTNPPKAMSVLGSRTDTGRKGQNLTVQGFYMETLGQKQNRRLTDRGRKQKGQDKAKRPVSPT